LTFKEIRALPQTLSWIYRGTTSGGGETNVGGEDNREGEKRAGNKGVEWRAPKSLLNHDLFEPWNTTGGVLHFKVYSG